MKFNLEKNIQILTYFTEKEGGSINYTKVLKLLFFADKYYLRRTGKMISWNPYSALKLWPVASIAYDMITRPEDFDKEKIEEYIERREYNITALKSTDKDYLAKTEIEALDIVYEEFGKYNYSTLCDMTHEYEEWRKHDWVAQLGSCDSMNIEDFFLDSKNQSSIFSLPEEHLDLSKQIFAENRAYVS